jgi:hypothetical protein
MQNTARLIILSVLMWKTITSLFAVIAIRLLPLQLAFTIWRDPQYKNFGLELPYLVSIWSNFDGFFYLAIARDGYLSGQQPFFPLYPILIRLVTDRLALPYALSAQIISLAALVGAIGITVKLLAVDRKTALTPLVFAAILSFPTSYSYGASYNDALFFFLATLTLYFGRTRQWIRAGLAGAIATLARLNGLALFPFLITEYVLSWTGFLDIAHSIKALGKGLTIKRICASRIWMAVLVPLAFLLYAAWVHRQFGDWQTLFRAMAVWGQDKLTFPPQVLWRYIKIIVLNPAPSLAYWVAIVEFGSVLLYGWAAVWSIGKIRWSYWIFFVVSLLIPSATGTFQGMPRYGLHLYPLFLIISMALSDKTRLVQAIYVLVMLLLLFFCVTLFTRGYFIA